MNHSHLSLTTALLAFALTGSAVAQRATPKSRPPANPAPVTVSIPLGADEITESIQPASDLVRGSGEQELVHAVAQASGARVMWVSATKSLMLTGVPAQLELAKATVEKMTTTARNVAAEAQAAQRKELAAAEAADLGALDIDFAGGSVREYLELVGHKANFSGFVINNPKELDGYQLPPIVLRKSGLLTAVEVVDKICYPTDEQGRARNVAIEWVGEGFDGFRHGMLDHTALLRSVCLVRPAPEQAKQSATKAPTLQRAVFDLTALRESGNADVQAIIGAVTLGIEMEGPSSTFSIKFHEPSRLLLIRGTTAEITIARDIVQTRMPVGESSTAKATAEANTESSAPRTAACSSPSAG